MLLLKIYSCFTQFYSISITRLISIQGCDRPYRQRISESFSWSLPPLKFDYDKLLVGFFDVDLVISPT